MKPCVAFRTAVVSRSGSGTENRTSEQFGWLFTLAYSPHRNNVRCVQIADFSD